jgi:hypothetical protein
MPTLYQISFSAKIEGDFNEMMTNRLISPAQTADKG